MRMLHWVDTIDWAWVPRLAHKGLLSSWEGEGASVRHPVLTLTGCVTFSELLNLSVLQFPYR